MSQPFVSQRLRILTLMACMVLGVALGVSWERYRAAKTLTPIRLWNSDGAVIGQRQSPPQNVASDVDFALFWEVWKTIKERYYEQPLPDKSLFYGALAGLANGTGDPYTTFFMPQEAEDFEQNINGLFGGIGAEIGIKKDLLQIVAPLPDTPAARAGLLAGDFIVKIDGEDTSGFSVERAVHKIRGEKGTQVTLSIYRPEAKQSFFDVSIIRDTIRVTSVKIKTLPDNIVLIELSGFHADTAELFEKATRNLARQKPRGVVLDLRNNPGGLLDQSQRIAAAWTGDKVVVKQRRQGQVFEELRGLGKARLHELPTIILVNQGSASAAEIVAGALQDYRLATLIGSPTFGKGSVQEVRNFTDGSAVKITVAEWLTPLERTINKTGLEPDIEVLQTPEDYAAKRDPVLQRAVDILTGSVSSTARNTTTSSATP